ncbi:MAG TPA: helix-turn-helix transcriptional regulator [Candidatus Rubneribacter avistercoris]|nr:helix-turn-helix transcriptional regulator [Candidatus Rubneribacter avistercoris]
MFFAVRFRLRAPERRDGSCGDSDVAAKARDRSAADVGREACLVVAESAGLSARETEVLALVLKGRDLPYIAEKLVVSKNTVRTHMRNIYAKLGVHSKQEVIDLVDGQGGER